MASYDNLLAEQPWSFRPSFPDTWISDLFTMENETLAKAMQASISGCAAASPHGGAISSGMLQPMYSKADATPVHTPTVSGVSENEALVSKQRRRGCGVPPIGGRVAKRKSRPSKRAAATTFYAADPENFMRMVQQVTGMRIGGATERLPCATAVSRPEPRRAADGFPTLDTSAAFMLDSSASSLVSTSYAAAAGDGGAAAAEHYFDSLCSFPTLESWEAV